MSKTVIIRNEDGSPLFVGSTDKLIFQQRVGEPAIVALVAEQSVADIELQRAGKTPVGEPPTDEFGTREHVLLSPPPAPTGYFHTDDGTSCLSPMADEGIQTGFSCRERAGRWVSKGFQS